MQINAAFAREMSLATDGILAHGRGQRLLSDPKTTPSDIAKMVLSSK